MNHRLLLVLLTAFIAACGGGGGGGNEGRGGEGAAPAQVSVATTSVPAELTLVGVTGAVEGVEPADRSVRLAAASEGSSSQALSANLSSVGAADWAAWGNGGVPGLVRKADGGSLINATLLQSATATAYNNDLRSLAWSGGTPQASNGGSKNGIFVSGVGAGFSVTVPAGTASRSVTIYVGGWNSSGSLRAHLSDSSAADYVDTTTVATGQYVRAYTIVYAAGSAGQQVVLTWVQAAGTGNVTLNGVALGAAALAPNRAPTLQTPAAQSGTQGQQATLALVGSDPDGDPLNYSATGLPAGLNLSATTGAISGAPTAVGSSTVVATVRDNRGGSAIASFVWTVQPAPPGSLSGSNAQLLSANLSTSGTADWTAWGNGGVPGLVRKTNGGSLISAYTVVQGGGVTAYNNDLRALSWSDGAPQASNAGSKNGVFITGVGTGFSVSVPASTTSRTVTLYVGGWRSSGTFRAHLSDSSTADYVDTTPLATSQYVRAYTIVYAAGIAGQQLVLTWTQAAGDGNVTINGATLSVPAVNQPPVLAVPAAQTSIQGRPANLAMAGSDPDGDALSYSATGLPVGLAIAPATGAISGTPTTVGLSAVVVTAADGRGGSASASFSWNVQAPPPPNLASGLDTRPSNTTCVAPQRPQAGTGLALGRVFSNLSFNQPVGMYQAPGDSTRWFVIEQQSGLVRSFPNTPNVQASQVTTALNIGAKLQADGEMGLLGLAFHPQWPATPQVFVYYSVAGTNPVENRVSRFTSANPTATDGAVFDPASEQVILRLVKNQSTTNHNGGNIVFGPDGYLYIGTGDGGGGGDPMNNAQNLNVLFGKMLRIDVNVPSGYAIPAGASGNPAAGNPQCTNGTGTQPCPEVFAHGLRNPWRWSFDRSTGDLWVADVGQDAREEIDVVRRGGNYGWRIREGSVCYSPGTNCGTTSASGDPLVDPLVEYAHDIGFAVTGGYVYRGTKLPDLVGRYVFADYVSSRLFVFQPPVPLLAATPRKVLAASDTALTAPQNVTALAQANDGELYVVGYGGGLYALQAATAAVDTIPNLLSQTGCVAADAKQPAAGLIPYTPNAPFWSDGAEKLRWLALPNGSSITPTATPQTPGPWSAPNGTVLVKSFVLNNQLIETRLLMRHPDGVWAGYTYEWNAAQTDATRVVGGKSKAVVGGAGNQTWIYPSENDCLLCHTQVAGRTLGLETAQFNGAITYPQTGRLANQITTLNSVGLLSPTIAGDPATLPAYVDPHGTAGTVEQRARAFLHTNCSQCHQPNGPTPVALDLRYSTPLAQTGTCNAAPISGDLGLTNAKVIAPGAPDSSVLLSRVNRRDSSAMPPLGSTLVDTQSVAVLRQWIQGLTGCQ